MKIAISKFFLVVLFLFSASHAWCQVKESDKLKKQQKQIEEKIAFTENLLKSTETNKVNLSSSIGLISNKIKYREALLSNINVQLNTLNAEIKTLKSEVKLLDAQLQVLIQQYKSMIVQSYKMRSESASVFFILSSTNFNQASKRMLYLNQLTKFRADQIQRIKALRNSILEKQQLIEEKRLNQEQLLKSKESEKSKYVRDREGKIKTIKNLEGKEQKLQKELQDQKIKANNIKKAISAAIRKEIEATRKKEVTKPRTVAETKEIALNNSGFEGNKGRLPWPVSKGEITKGFGKQAHPVHVGIYTYNKGLDISTVKGANVRCVYKGKVSSIINIPGAGKAVIVAHGNYRTIYSNLQSVYVQKGASLDTKDEIGALLINPDGSPSEVHFEIVKITAEGKISNLNPSFWLYQ
ncbi:MAG: murein hydrolase activator EnvC [Crocinitomicaceae bacterium]